MVMLASNFYKLSLNLQKKQNLNRVSAEQKEILKEKEGNEGLRWEDIEKMRYSWNVACEVMRIVPPLSGTFREANDHFSFKGFYIPKGWKVSLNPNCLGQILSL